MPKQVRHDLYQTFETASMKLWTQKGKSAFPKQEDLLVSKTYGDAVLQKLHLLKDTFYKSTAARQYTDLSIIQSEALKDFKAIYPDADESVKQMLAWCYLYDYFW